MAQDPSLPKFEIPLNDKGGATSKNWYFFFQGLLNSIGGGVTKIIAGTNVTISPTSGVGNVTVNASGGGGSSLTLTDGTHTVTPVGQITVTGGTVGGTTPNATLTIAGGGSGTVTSVALSDASTNPIYTVTGSPVTTSGTLTETLKTQTANTVFAGPTTGAAAQPSFRSVVFADISSVIPNFNITPDTHPALPTGVGIGPNDEFETGSSIDTAGTRYSGATAWTAFNVGSGATAITNNVALGSLILSSGTTAVGSATIKGYSQPIASPATYVAKVQAFGNAGTLQIDAGIFLSENATGKAVTLDIRIDASAGLTTFVTSWSSPTTGVANLFTGNANPSTFTDSTARFSGFSMYLQVVVTATTLAFSFSRSGLPGTYVLGTSFLKTAEFTVGPDIIGLYISPDANTAFVQPSAGVFDFFRRTA